MTTPTAPVPTGDQTPKLLGTIIPFDILALIVVILRFLSRRIAHASLWWDDWLMFPALVGSLASNLFVRATHSNTLQVLFIASVVVDAGGTGALSQTGFVTASHV